MNITKNKLNTIISVANHHLVDSYPDDLPSASLCYQRALTCEANGDLLGAFVQAHRSLAYSIGVFHFDYQKFLPKC